MDSAQRRRVGFALLLFFLSGASALVYEVLWFRRFAQLWGSSSLAMAVVMATFLLGLGVGARTLGALADRMRRPLLGYAACEAAIGLWALAVPSLLALLRNLYARSYPLLGERPALFALLQVGLAALVLGPPCLAMGATLPFLVRQLAREGGGLGVPTSLLYALNALGAASGCALAGFVLLPALGLDGTQAAAVATNLAIALAALPLARALPAVEIASAPGDPAPSGRLPPRPALSAAAALVGFAALVLQMVWARQLAIALGGSTYAFSAMLTVVLVGIGAGSLFLPPLLRRARDPSRLVGPLVTALVLTLAAGQAALPLLSEVIGDLGHLRASQLFNALLCGAASASLELLPAACAGTLFPLLVHLSGGTRREAGLAVGRVFFWNTLGTTLGALLAHALLIPLVGTYASVLLALLLYLCAWAILVAPLATPRRVLERAAAVLLLGLCLWLLPRHDPRLTERGLFVYGPGAREVFAGAPLVFHAEGASANVLVSAHGPDRVLRVNGKVDASTFQVDQRMQIGCAYLPFLLRPSAREIFVVGYGSGATAGALLQFPDTRVTCAEIEPAVFRATAHFASINHRPDLSPRFEIRFEDGRGHLAGTARTYDLIVTEPSNPWMAGVGNLFTREFLLAARERLAPEGLLAQWIQAYAFSPIEYRRILRTMGEVFEHMALLRMTPGDTILLGSRFPIVPPPEVLEPVRAFLAGAGAAPDDLREVFGSADPSQLLLEHCILGGAELRALAGSLDEEGIVTDANQRLEFDAPLRLFERERVPGERVDDFLLEAVSGAWSRELARTLGADPAAASGLARLQGVLRAKRKVAGAEAMLALGLELSPEHPGLIAERLIHGELEAVERERLLSKLVPLSASEALRVALALADKDPEGALACVERVLEALPESLTARAHRAALLWRLRRADEARAELEQLLRADPLHETVRATARLLRSSDG